MRYERMAMLALVLALVLVLWMSGSGCGSSSAPPANHGFGWDYDALGAAGLRLRHAGLLQPGDPLADPALYEKVFAEVQACTGFAASAPFIILVPDGSLPGTTLGRYLPAPSLILLDRRALRDGNTDYIRHESVHYLLDVNTGNLDAQHESALFMVCGIPAPRSRR